MRILLLLLALLFLSCSDSESEAWIDPPISGELSYKEWGVHQIQNGAGTFTEELTAQLEKLGPNATFVATFTDLPRPISASVIKEAHDLGLTPVISFEPSKTWRDNKQDELEGILSGYWDSTLTSWAKALADLEDTVIIRFGYEMNGNWFAYGQKPDLFKLCWNYTHELFKSAGADNVLWMFSPNVEWDDGGALCEISQYYPGDERVDLLGLDGYNFGDNHDEYHWWQSYSYIFEESIQKMSAYNKPLYLAEIGCAEDSRQAGWIDDFLKRVSRDDRVKGFLYFNQHTMFKGEPDWCLSCDPATLDLFHIWRAQNDSLFSVN